VSKKLLYRNDQLCISVYLHKNDRLEIAIPGRSIQKSISSWVTDDTTYSNRILVERINELENMLKLK
jgi:hypothetical protein